MKCKKKRALQYTMDYMKKGCVGYPSKSLQLRAYRNLWRIFISETNKMMMVMNASARSKRTTIRRKVRKKSKVPQIESRSC